MTVSRTLEGAVGGVATDNSKVQLTVVRPEHSLTFSIIFILPQVCSKVNFNVMFSLNYHRLRMTICLNFIFEDV